MVKHNPLNTLADLAQDDTDKAARELGRLQGCAPRPSNSSTR
jgi:flagellar FliJ protein